MENRERHLSTADIAASSEQPEVQPERVDSAQRHEGAIALGNGQTEQPGNGDLRSDQSVPLFSNDSIHVIALVTIGGYCMFYMWCQPLEECLY